MEYIDAKSIVTNTKSLNWNYLCFEYVMNIYWGCSHGCIYCYMRSDYYDEIGKLNGNFDSVRAKRNALQIIRDDLRRKIRKGVVFTGGTSDSYNPEEKEHRLTRNALELINAFEFGACILTKSDLVTRDTDILTDIREHSPASVNFSITCADDATCQKIEPAVSTSTQRFRAVEHLAKNGIPTGVLIDPLLPYITDTEENVRELVKKAKHHGASYIYISTQVTMSGGQREYFYEEAEKHFPGTAETYRQKYKEYYYCRSPHAKKLWSVFAEACEKEGLLYDMRAANQMVRQGYNISVLDIL
ncbi:MAG: radical SAM protein [Oscillospiraceae bacterium]